MANKKISELPAGSNFMAASAIEGVESGTNVQYTPDQTNPFRGSWAGTTSFPTTGGRYTGGVPAAGDHWVLTDELVVSGNVYSEGSIIFSKVNLPGQSLSNWAVLSVQL